MSERGGVPRDLIAKTQSAGALALEKFIDSKVPQKLRENFERDISMIRGGWYAAMDFLKKDTGASKAEDAETQKFDYPEDVTWNCRFHPIDWRHEVGCPHMEWTNEQLLDHLITKKRFEQSVHPKPTSYAVPQSPLKNE